MHCLDRFLRHYPLALAVALLADFDRHIEEHRFEIATVGSRNAYDKLNDWSKSIVRHCWPDLQVGSENPLLSDL